MQLSIETVNDSSKLSFVRRGSLRLLSWTVLTISGFPLINVAAASAADTAPLFSSTEALEVTITAPLDRIMSARSEDEEHESTLTYVNEDAENVELTVNVRVRGKFRARHDICDFAPLRLNFKKKQVKGTLFEDQDKVKLVTHCENSGAEHEQNVLKEYLTYQFLAKLTDLSFRTRLLRVTYIDSDGEHQTRTKYGFIIEHEDDLAERLDAHLAMVKSATMDNLDAAQGNLFAVFSYFIGNTDFSAQLGPKEEYCCHNAVLLTRDPGIYLPVPYDFDLSGMVDAPYAAPNPKYDIKRVTDRLYRGLCRDIDTLPDTLRQFVDLRETFETMVDEQDGLRLREKAVMKGFIDDFYDDIKNDKLIERNLIQNCQS